MPPPSRWSLVPSQTQIQSFAKEWKMKHITNLAVIVSFIGGIPVGATIAEAQQKGQSARAPR